jgi:hypothetical protein
MELAEHSGKPLAYIYHRLDLYKSALYKSESNMYEYVRTCMNMYENVRTCTKNTNMYENI